MAHAKYDPSFCDKALQLYPEGLTDAEFSAALGIAESSLYNYQNKHPEFREAIRQGKRGPNKVIEAAVFKAAAGYDYTEEKYERVVTVTKDATTGKERQSVRYVLTERTVKHQPPNATLAKFYLVNRAPEAWKDRQEVAHSGGLKITHEQALSELE